MRGDLKGENYTYLIIKFLSGD